MRILRHRSAAAPKELLFKVILSAYLVSAAVGFTLPSFNPYMRAATVTFGVLLAGAGVRRISVRAHALLMTSGVLADLALLLLVELNRGAIKTATGLKLSPLQNAHVLFSTIAVLLYLPALYLGMRSKGRKVAPGEVNHRTLGELALLSRAAGYFLMFSMLGRH